MSHSHIDKAPPPPTPVNRWIIALVCATLPVLSLACYLTVIWIHASPTPYETANGKILEFRNAVVGTWDVPYGGIILYKVEAHVQYTVNGQLQDRWLRASDGVSRETMAVKLAAHPTECVVYWPPDHPEQAKCSLK